MRRTLLGTVLYSAFYRSPCLISRYGAVVLDTLLSFDSNIKKPILVPNTLFTSTKSLLAMKYKHYSYDRRRMLQKNALKLPLK